MEATAAGAPAVAALKALPKLMAARKPGLEHIKGTIGIRGHPRVLFASTPAETESHRRR